MTSGATAVSPASDTSVAVLGPVALTAALAGSALALTSYQSLEPLAVAAIAFCAGALLVVVLFSERLSSLATYSLLFGVGWLMAGVGGFYAEVLRDPLQWYSDASTFYDLARAESVGLSLEEVVVLTEGVGAVFAWRWVYDGMSWLGFEKGRYIGLSINVLAVALSGVLAARACQLLYPGDAVRLARLQVMLACCGLFWLFSAVHLRDAFILLLVTLTFFVWLRQLVRPGAVRLAGTVAQTLALGVGLGLLRQEFVLVPVVIGTLAALARAFTSPSGAPSAVRRLLWICFGIVVVTVVLVVASEDLLHSLSHGAKVYSGQVSEQAAAGSLGNALIVQQPLPLRALLGLVYLFVYPIPVWSGLQLESVAMLLKSLNAAFFYAFTPLFLLAAGGIGAQRGRHRTVAVFMLAVVLLFGVGIALTSLETRHFGAFLVPALCLALAPDLAKPAPRRQYWVALLGMLAAMAALHLAWAVVKLT